MKIGGLASLMCALALLPTSACVAPLKQILPVEGRAVAGGRNMLVTVAQNEINPTIAESNITSFTGGGLLFAAIDAGVNTSRAKSAEAAIVSIRDALTDYSFDQKASAAAAQFAQSVDWLAIDKSELNKDASLERFSRALDASAAPQLLSISYDYVLTPAFDAIKVGANLNLLVKEPARKVKPEQRALLGNAAFTRPFVCVVPLPGATSDREQNATLWIKDGGSGAEESLDKALAKLSVLMKKGMELTAEQEAAFKSAKRVTLGGYRGEVIEEDAEGTLLQVDLGRGFWVYVFAARSS